MEGLWVRPFKMTDHDLTSLGLHRGMGSIEFFSGLCALYLLKIFDSIYFQQS